MRLHSSSAAPITPPPPASPTSQGDYSIRKLSAAVEEEAAHMAAQRTPDPASLLIGAYHAGGAARTPAGSGHGGGWHGGGAASAGADPAVEKRLSKTPGGLFTNPLSLLSPWREQR